MRAIKKLLLWYWLLNKRLFRRAGFIIILLIVPVLVLAMSFAAKKDSGILSMGLFLKDSSDPVASEIARTLMEDDNLFKYHLFESEKETINAVRSGRVDAAWVFESDVQEKIAGYTSGSSKDHAVTVYEQEENVFLQLAREKLFGAMYTHVSYSIFKDFIAVLDPGGNPSEEELIRDYNTLEVEAPLVQFAYMSGKEASLDEQGDYLTTPLRGLMALMVMLCALMSCAFYLQDEEEGCFVWLNRRTRVFSVYGYCMTAVLDMAVMVIAALALSGLLSSWLREIILMLIYCFGAVAFSSIIRRICGTIERLGLAMPLIMMALLALCPVFLNVKKVRFIQFFIPTFHYLHGVFSLDYSLYLAALTVLLFAVDLLLDRLMRKGKRA